MMNAKKFRNFAFYLHRYIGLAVGLIAIAIGLTGSLLVFHKEIDEFQIQQQIGIIVPQEEQLPVETVLNTVQSFYAKQPDASIQRIFLPDKPDDPFEVVLKTKESDWLPIYVNPYTGQILSNSLKPNVIQSFFKIVYELHYALLAGDIGYTVVGIIGLLVSFLSITGIILWPGWRRLIAGFKIKWNASPKRVNFDIHKVAGIVAAIFLFFTFFTGFCWNLGSIARPLIYAATLSQIPPEDPISKPISGQSPLKFSNELLQKADAALPGFKTVYVALPSKMDGTSFIVRKKSSPDQEYWDSSVFIDSYSGEILRVDNGLTESLGVKVENAFIPLHYGTFWGLSSRILYVFVGLSPLILFITGFAMYRDRHRPKAKSKNASG
ncbi:MAG: PepSY domain-containing protein [Hydrococcus sp. Prado102]|jgi:uncharacterized iron-regulated membrane protein|nr:PepSY domain-containing protein [Hydrococcus sp. Prado102]